MKVLLIMMCFAVLSAVSLADDMAVVDLVPQVDSTGIYIYDMLYNAGYDIDYQTMFYPWHETPLLIVWTGMGAHELDQQETVLLIDHLISGRDLLLFGSEGAFWIMVYWCMTEVAPINTDPIGVLTGAGPLAGFNSTCQELALGVCSSCIGGMVESVLSGDNNFCSSRATIYQDSTYYGYKTAVISVNPMHIDALLQLMNMLIQNHFGIFPTGIKEEIAHPRAWETSLNYPNPFNAATTISFTLPRSSNVVIEIYNLVGQKVITLYEGYLSSGEHSVVWQARDQVSGIYFYKIAGDEFSLTRKMSLIK